MHQRTRYLITAIPLIAWLAYLSQASRQLAVSIPMITLAMAYAVYSLYAGIRLVKKPWLAQKLLYTYVMVGAALIPFISILLFYLIDPSSYPVILYIENGFVTGLDFLFVSYIAMDLAFEATPLCPFRNYTVPLKFQKNYGLPLKLNFREHGCANCSIVSSGFFAAIILFWLAFAEQIMLTNHLLH